MFELKNLSFVTRQSWLEVPSVAKAPAVTGDRPKLLAICTPQTLRVSSSGRCKPHFMFPKEFKRPMGILVPRTTPVMGFWIRKIDIRYFDPLGLGGAVRRHWG